MLRPPMVPVKTNAVISYVRYFDVDERLRGNRLFIVFEGVEQAMNLYLNGEFIGYSEDSFTPAEFDITNYVRDTGNRLAVEVFKRTKAAYIEDQDFFRFSGIFRPVYIYAKPECHIDDIDIRSTLLPEKQAEEPAHEEKKGFLNKLRSMFSGHKDRKDGKVFASGNGRFSLSLKLSATDSFQLYEVSASLSDAEGNVLYEKRCGADSGIAFDEEDFDVRPYSNKDPYLYTLRLEVLRNDKTVETVEYPVGFRRIEIIDKVIYLNGERLIINGVNRHEWSPYTGRAISLREMEEDISIMKRNYINSVRTCHYPDSIPFYFMCNEAGIYVMAETNLESHGSWQKMGAVEPSWNVPGDDPAWKDIVLDRARSNYETFKNNPVDLYTVATDAYTGKAVYCKLGDGGERDLEWMRASASMPVVSRAVNVDGYTLFDGGVSDSIPIRYFMDLGYERNIVVLTRPRGYRKKEGGCGFITKVALRKYPRMIEALDARSREYNQTLDYLDSLEKEGKVLIIAPTSDLHVKRIEKDKAKIQAMYDLGVSDTESRLSEIREFLE